MISIYFFWIISKLNLVLKIKGSTIQWYLFNTELELKLTNTEINHMMRFNALVSV